MPDNGSSHGIDPILFLLIRICNEIHRLLVRGKLECMLFVQNICRASYGTARGNRDDSTGPGISANMVVFEPEEHALFEDEPAATPGFDILALF